MQHLCHAHNCSVPVPPHLFMCKKHWSMLPSELKAMIHKYYRKGQEIDKKPSSDYLFVSKLAVQAIRKAEGL